MPKWIDFQQTAEKWFHVSQVVGTYLVYILKIDYYLNTCINRKGSKDPPDRESSFSFKKNLIVFDIEKYWFHVENTNFLFKWIK